tara:strand:+ start:2014 stop:3300 length:1287 start_codon:yes stop_codon:yes gene_type:complete
MKNYKISIIGLGYVGLPLAVEFSKYFKTIGFDINKKRVLELKSGIDSTYEIENDDLKKVLIKNDNQKITKGFLPTNDVKFIEDSNVYIITVPTPTDKNKRPVLKPLRIASESVANFLKKGDLVIYESTVYPGVTEDICIPILEKVSSLSLNSDFGVGYSPERINPGDKERTVTKILKITSGSNDEVANEIDQLYKTIIKAGTFLAKSIKVAEAAKVIENSQRDINIAFVNELAKIFNLLKIDTNAVLEAAETKWNFLPFKPGLVGGHCIGVDPYYLAQKAQEVGYHPEIILSGRRLNDSMGIYVANEILKLLVKKDIQIKDSSILILGITFKENCPDIRNTKVIDIINHLKSFNMDISIYDPLADPKEVKIVYDLNLITELNEKSYDAIVLAVSHDEFHDIEFDKIRKDNSVLYDVKNFIGDKADGKL